MTEYLLLAFSADVYTNDKGEKYDCRYLVIKKDDNVKPMVYKCAETAFNEAKQLTGCRVNLTFDERGRINGIKAVSKS